MNHLKSIRFAATLLLSGFLADAAPMGTAFTYQGRLHDDGMPADGLYDFNFKLYDVLAGGIPLEPTAGLSRPGIGVTNGLFTVTLDFGAAFDGNARWLDISVNTNLAPPQALVPRQELTPEPYALYASRSGSAASASSIPWSGVSGFVPGQGIVSTPGGLGVDLGFSDLRYWKLGGNAGTTPGLNFLGTTGPEALELKANSQRALRLEPDSQSPRLIGGYAGNAITTGAGGVIAGGGSSINPNLLGARYGVVGGGAGNINLTPFGVVSGGFGNRVEGASDDTLSGGSYNRINGAANVIAGGTYNTNLVGSFGTIGGGSLNLVQSPYSATIGGGYQNTVQGQDATIGGGSYNAAQADYSIIAGGRQNFVGTTIYDGGGFFVTNDAPFSANLGGYGNRISSDYSGVSSGYGNGNYGDYGFIGGGLNNRISAPGLESGNTAGATIAGGLRNQVYGGGATIAGGEENEAGALWSAIPGGLQALTRSQGQLAFASGMFQEKGDAQTSVYVVRGSSSDATPTELYLDGNARRMRVPANGVWAFDALIVGKRTGAFALSGIQMRGVAANVGGAMTIFMQPITKLGFTANASTWDAHAFYDNTDRALVIQVVGQAGAQIRWTATIRTSELIAP